MDDPSLPEGSQAALTDADGRLLTATDIDGNVGTASLKLNME